MKIILASLIVLLIHASTDAADKIRIGVPELNAPVSSSRFSRKAGFL